MNYEKLDEALEYIDVSNHDEIVPINEVTLHTSKYFGLGMNPVYTHPGYAYDPYVKVFNNPNYAKATKSIDVSIAKGIAFHHPRDKKQKLQFKESGWKEFLDEAVRKIVDPPVNSGIYKADKYYSLSDMAKGESYIRNKKPYRIYEWIYDKTMEYFVDYKQDVINLYNAHPEPKVYSQELIYKE